MASDALRVLIVGGGPAGLTAAIYAARAALQPVLIAGAVPGGQLMYTTDIENFPGFATGLPGPELMARMQEQAARVGTKIVSDEVKALDLKVRPFEAKISTGETLRAHTVIFATGANARMLNLPEESAFFGGGLSTCAVCDGFFFKKKDVLVVGGGDSAMEDATYLAKICTTVTVVHRRQELRASKIMQERARAMANIRWELDQVPVEVLGDRTKKLVTGARLKNVKTGAAKDLKADAVFLAIGHVPTTDLVKGQIHLDEEGYIVANERQETNVPGFFAAGDCHDRRWRQAITAAGFGCRAALEVERYLTREGIH